MSIRVRRANENDIDLIAWVMLAAARSHLDRGIWEYLNDHDEAQTLDYLRRVAVTDTVHLFHHSLFLVAELDGEAGAAMCGYDSGTEGFEAFGPEMATVSSMCGIDMTDPEYGRRMGVMLSGFSYDDDDGPPGPRWVIENVATKPDFRRKGLVDALLHQLLGAGRERGFSTAQIGVYIGNEWARRAYVKAGFETVAEARSADFEREIGCPGSELLLQPL